MTKEKRREGASVALALNGSGFVLGALGGMLLAAWLSGRGGVSLQDWMDGYALAFTTAGGLRVPFGAILWDMARWPLFLWLLGYTGMGRWMIPAALGLRGFLLAYGIAALAWSVSGGLILALVLFGLGSLVSLPVCFLLGVQSWERAVTIRGRLFALRGGQDGRYWRKSAVSLGALLLGALMEYWFLPPLLEGLAPLLERG